MFNVTSQAGRLVWDINAPGNNASSSPTALATLNGRLYIAATNNSVGTEVRGVVRGRETGGMDAQRPIVRLGMRHVVRRPGARHDGGNAAGDRRGGCGSYRVTGRPACRTALGRRVGVHAATPLCLCAGAVRALRPCVCGPPARPRPCGSLAALQPSAVTTLHGQPARLRDCAVGLRATRGPAAAVELGSACTSRVWAPRPFPSLSLPLPLCAPRSAWRAAV
jgi:hypothetical protein